MVKFLLYVFYHKGKKRCENSGREVSGTESQHSVDDRDFEIERGQRPTLQKPAQPSGGQASGSEGTCGILSSP